MAVIADELLKEFPQLKSRPEIVFTLCGGKPRKMDYLLAVGFRSTFRFTVSD